MIEFCQLYAEDLFSFEELLIDYKTGLTLVTGVNEDSTSASSNYSGKSNALVEIPLWVLYEKGTKEISPDGKVMSSSTKESAIRRGQSKALGRICFTVDGIKYTVTRTRTKTKSTLTIEQQAPETSTLDTGKIKIGGKDKAGTQKIINDLIGDYDTFTQVVFFAQGTKRFTEAKDSERKRVLDSLLSLDRFSKALAVTNKELVPVRHELEQIQMEADLLDVKIRGKRERYDDAKEAHERLLESYNSWEGNHLKRVTRAESKKSEIEIDIINTEAKIQRIEKELSEEEEDTILDDLYTKRNKLDNVTSKLAISKVNEQHYRGKLVKEQESMSQVDGVCPACLQDIDEEQEKKIQEDIERKMEESRQQEEALLIEYDKKHEQLVEVRKEIMEHEKVAAAVEASRAQQNDLKKDLFQHNEDLKAIISEIISISTEKGPSHPGDSALGGSLKKELEALEDQRLELQTRRGELTLQLAELYYWQKAFGNQGIKSLLFDNVLPVLNAKTNEYASVLMGEDVEIEFDTESYLKSGEARDKFDVRVSTEGGDGYHLCSIGQRGRINFAIALALQALQVASGKRTNLFVCDEPFESIDDAGQDGITELLGQFAQENNLCVYVITHLSELASRFKNQITIKKNGGVSCVR
jgi:DNA repair exonuclease SbcCD ATPase subunit